MWPPCGALVIYLPGGKRQQFCHLTHRVGYSRERARLLSALDDAHERRQEAVTKRQIAAADRAVHVLQWQLVRFPALA